MEPALVENEVQEPEARLGGHPPADPPAVLGVLQSVVTLPHPEADLPQHGGEFVRANVRVQLPAGQQRVAEPDDGLAVRDLKLLEVPQQHLGVEVQALVSHEDDVPAETLEPFHEGHQTVDQVEALQLLSVPDREG